MKRERIDKALAKEGVPYPTTAAAGGGNLSDSSEEDLSSYGEEDFENMKQNQQQ